MLIARAPVRISFAGGGTDLAAYYERFGGLVISAAITRYCYVVADRTDDGSIRLSSADYRLWEMYPAGSLPPVTEPLALPKAAIARFARHGIEARGIDLFLSAEVPPGSGLGSSSAMAAALIRALGAYTGVALRPHEVAELACSLEIEELGMPIGKQDQYASAFGGLNSIAFSAHGVTVTPLDLPHDVVAALNSRLLLFSTGQTRDSASILRQQRADSGANPAVIQSLHRIKGWAEEMSRALQDADLDLFGRLLDRAWREKKRLSNKISSTSIDTWYAAARAAGATGGKITGAGGGGFLLLYCPPRYHPCVRAAMTAHGLREMTFDFTLAGAQIVDTRAGVHGDMPTMSDRERLKRYGSNARPAYPRRAAS